MTFHSEFQIARLIFEGGVSSIVDSMHDVMRRGRGGSQRHSDVTLGKNRFEEQTNVARCGKKSLVFIHKKLLTTSGHFQESILVPIPIYPISYPLSFIRKVKHH